MIEPKLKRCKGINKAHGVKGCGTLTLHRNMGLCANCLADFLFGTDAGKLIFNKSVLPKAKKATAKENKTKDDILRESLNPKSYYEKKLQTEINKIVKYLDAGWPCIATNSNAGKRNAGHYFSVGSNPTLRYHLENIWNQSEHSNSFKSGDTIKYQEGLIKLFGSDYLEYLNSLKQIHLIKLSIDNLKEKTSIARGIVKWLILQDRRFSLDERLSLRLKFNSEIGIYT